VPSLAALLLFAGAAWSQECVDTSTYMHLISSTPTPNYAQSVTLDGNLAYVGASGAFQSGFYIVDISAPNSMPVIGGMTGSFWAYDIALAGDRAFVAASGSAVEVFDVSVPGAVSAVGTIPVFGECLSIAVEGAYAYALAGAYLRIIWNNPVGVPVLTGFKYFNGYGQRIRIDGSVAYVAAGAGGLTLFDVSIPGAPAWLSEIDTPGYSHDVAVLSGLAYVADGDSGLRIFDVAAPLSPVFVGVCDVGFEAQSVAVRGTTAVVGGGSRRVAMVDVTDPSDPFVLATIPMGEGVQDIVLSADTAYFATWDQGLQAFRADQLLPVPSTGTVELVARDVALSGHHAFVAGSFDGLRVVDVQADPPSVVATLDTPGEAMALQLVGSTAYVADDAGGLRVIDVTDPLNPSELGAMQPLAPPLDVAVSGNYAYTVPFFNVVNISNPMSMSVVASLVIQNARQVVVVGNYAYVADFASDLVIVNIANPLAPFIARTHVVPGRPEGVALLGTRLVVFNDENEILFYDLSIPTYPLLVGTIQSPWGGGFSIAGDDSIAYLASYQAGVTIYDITDLSTPQRIGSLAMPYDAAAVALHAGAVYVAGDLEGLTIYPQHCDTPVPVGTEPTSVSALRLSAFPNPMRAGTQVFFQSPRASSVQLDVYDVLGRHVRRVMSGRVDAGPQTRLWDGRDDQQQRVAQGIYFIRLHHADGVLTRRITVLR